MPITCAEKIRLFDQDDFHRNDRTVTGLCFDIHNEHGRLLDESSYQEALHQKCSATGIKSKRESEIKVVHGSFSKSYFLDLLVEGGIIYELKATSALTQTHESQLLNYLLLTNTKHGKIINFGGASVTSRFVSTSLTNEARQAHQIDLSNWTETTDNCGKAVSILKSILKDWGSHLSISLYRDALLQNLGGESKLSGTIPLHCGKTQIGTQRVILFNATTAFHCSGISKDRIHYKNHLTRLLNSTKLKQIQWINFNGHQIECSTLYRIKQL